MRRLQSTVFVVFVAALLAQLGPQAAIAVEHFVSPGQCAALTGVGLRPGDELVLRDGVYRCGGGSHIAGTEDAPIVVRAEHPGKAIIDGSFTARPTGWQSTEIPGVFRAAFVAGTPLAAFQASVRGAVNHPEPMHTAGAPGDCRYRRHCWYWDRATRNVFVRLATSATPADGEVVLSERPFGFMLTPRNRQASAHTTFSGLRLRYFQKAAIWVAGGSGVRVERSTLRSCGQGFVAYDSARATAAHNLIVGCRDQVERDAAGIMFLGRSPGGVATSNVLIDARDGGIRGQGNTANAVATGNIIIGSTMPLYFKRSGYPSVADGNLIIGGHVYEWPKTRPTKGSNVVVGVISHDRRAKPELVCALGNKCARSALATMLQGLQGPASLDKRQIQRAAQRLHIGRIAMEIPRPNRKNLAKRSKSHSKPRPTGRIRYVSPSGDDRRNGASATSAWRTLDRAAQAAEPGDTVILLPGVYRGELVPVRSGRRDAPITYRGIPGQPAILDGFRRARYVARLHGVQHVRLANLVFRGFHNVVEGGVLLDGAKHISIKSCLFDGRSAVGPGVAGKYNTINVLEISDSVFYGTWGAIRWQRGTLLVHHNVFDFGHFSGVTLHQRQARASVHHNAVTSAVVHKRHNAGFLVVTPDAGMVHSNHNRWFFQPGDHYEHIVRVAGRSLKGEAGLRAWQLLSGNDRRSAIVADPGFVGHDAKTVRSLSREVHIDRGLWRLKPKSPLRRAGQDKGDIGVRW